MRVVLHRPTTAGACTGHSPRMVRRGHGGSDPLLRATQRRPRRGPSRARAAARRLTDGALGEHYAVLTLGLAATVRQGPQGLAGGAGEHQKERDADEEERKAQRKHHLHRG